VKHRGMSVFDLVERTGFGGPAPQRSERHTADIPINYGSRQLEGPLNFCQPFGLDEQLFQALDFKGLIDIDRSESQGWFAGPAA